MKLHLLSFLLTWKLSRCHNQTHNENGSPYFMSANRLPSGPQENSQKLEERDGVTEDGFHNKKKHTNLPPVPSEREKEVLDFLCALIVIKNILKMKKEKQYSEKGRRSGQDTNRRRRDLSDEDFLREFSSTMTKAGMVCDTYSEPGLEETLKAFTKSGVPYEWWHEWEDKINREFKFTLKDMDNLNLLVLTYNSTDFSGILIDHEKDIAIPQVPADKCA